VNGTEKSLSCWCAIKKLLTHSLTDQKESRFCCCWPLGCSATTSWGYQWPTAQPIKAELLRVVYSLQACTHFLCSFNTQCKAAFVAWKTIKEAGTRLVAMQCWKPARANSTPQPQPAFSASDRTLSCDLLTRPSVQYNTLHDNIIRICMIWICIQYVQNSWLTHAWFPAFRIRCRNRCRSKVRKKYVHP